MNGFLHPEAETEVLLWLELPVWIWKQLKFILRDFFHEKIPQEL